MSPDLRLMSVPEFATRAGLGLRTVRRLIADGEVKVVRVGKRVLVSEPELERFVAAHTV